jgi:sugar phosphate isomerase/epimerase
MCYRLDVMSRNCLSRRSFLALAAAAPLAPAAGKKIPAGLELYSVRTEMDKDLMGTIKAVAKIGYPGVEFYGPYYDWTVDRAKEVRKLLDDLGIVCYSTHNNPKSFTPDGHEKAVELNKTLGSKFIVMASAGRVDGLDGWKKVADQLNFGAGKFKAAGIRAGYHNHAAEFRTVDGKRPIEVLAANTEKDVMLQLDVGTCVEVGSDPVAWINSNPGRIRSLHLKDFSTKANGPEGYQVLFGDGSAPWKKIFQAAEKTGGAEYYLIEQEGYSLPPLETVDRCLQNFKKIHG